MKKLGFFIATILFALTPAVNAASIKIPDLISYDLSGPWTPPEGPPESSHASIELYFDKKPDTNPDPFIYGFGDAFTKIDIHLSALVNGVWEDQSFTIESPSGSGNFRLEEPTPDNRDIFVNGQGFSAFIQTIRIDGEFAVLNVAARIYDYDYLTSERAYVDLSSFDVPEPNPALTLLLGLASLFVARRKFRS